MSMRDLNMPASSLEMAPMFTPGKSIGSMLIVMRPMRRKMKNGKGVQPPPVDYCSASSHHVGNGVKRSLMCVNNKHMNECNVRYTV